MKLIQHRGIKMLLHLVSISIFSVPITTHVLKLALDESFLIYRSFTASESEFIIVSILLLISANIISIVTDRFHKISMLLTGAFLFAVTITQLGVLYFGIPMWVFGTRWPESVSIIETSITGTFSVLLLMSSVFIRNGNYSMRELPKLDLSLKHIQKSMKKFQKNIEKLDCKLAFLLGIVGSMLVAIPLCGLLYLLAYLLLGTSGDSVFSLTVEKIKFLGWVGLVGMQGSIVSMFLSVRRFDDKINKDDSLDLFLNALLRPFIGLSLAHLSFFILESGLAKDIIEFGTMPDIEPGMSQNGTPTIDVSDANARIAYTFNYHVSIAFIAGFTERLARVLGSTGGSTEREGAISPNGQEKGNKEAPTSEKEVGKVIFNHKEIVITPATEP